MKQAGKKFKKNRVNKPSINLRKTFLLVFLSLLIFFSSVVVVDTLWGRKTSFPASKVSLLKPTNTTSTPVIKASSQAPLEKVLRVPIITYHYVRVVQNPLQDKLGVWLSVPPTLLKQELTYLKEHNFTIIDFDELNKALKGKSTLPNKPVLLTFDDGYTDFYENAFPLLKEFNDKATVFMIAGFVDRPRYLTTSALKEMDQSGLITIGVHSMRHPNLADPRTNLDIEITQAKKRLEEIVGHQLDYFAYPYGRYNQKVMDKVFEQGFQLAVSTNSGLEQTQSTRFRLKRNSNGASFNGFLLALGEINYSVRLATPSATPKN